MVSKLCVEKLCGDKLCVSKFVGKLCVSKFVCGSKLYVDKLCVSELCVSVCEKLMCVSQCVVGRAGGCHGGRTAGAEVQEPHTKMWGKTASELVPHEPHFELRSHLLPEHIIDWYIHICTYIHIRYVNMYIYTYVMYVYIYTHVYICDILSVYIVHT